MSEEATNGEMKSRSTIELPDQTYFKIGEVAKFLEVEPYVLRYWETEFEILEPEKTKSGQRVYQHDDIDLLFQIRTLLYEEMFTIAGACRQLERRRNGESNFFDLKEPQASEDTGSARSEQEPTKEDHAARQKWLRGAREKIERLEATVQSLRKRSSSMGEQSAALRQVLSSLREELVRGGQAGDDREALRQLEAEVASLKSERDELAEHSQRKERQLKRRLAQREEQRQQLLNELRREVEAIETVVTSTSRSG